MSTPSRRRGVTDDTFATSRCGRRHVLDAPGYWPAESHRKQVVQSSRSYGCENSSLQCNRPAVRPLRFSTDLDQRRDTFRLQYPAVQADVLFCTDLNWYKTRVLYYLVLFCTTRRRPLQSEHCPSGETAGSRSNDEVVGTVCKGKAVMLLGGPSGESAPVEPVSWATSASPRAQSGPRRRPPARRPVTAEGHPRTTPV